MEKRLRLRQKKLYGLVSVLGLFVVVTAMGGGLFRQHGAWFQHWQHLAFYDLCHQNPNRSFWIGGSPMAVCSRCFGIYAGFLAAWILFPFLLRWLSGLQGDRKKGLAGIVLLNMLDIVGNMVGVWENSLVSRFLMGSLLGIVVAFVIGYKFTETSLNINGINYGTDRAV